MLEPLLRGEKVFLAASEMSSDEFRKVTRWWQDTQFLRRMGSSIAMPPSEEAVRQMLDEWRKEKNSYSFLIRRVDSEEVIGTIGLFEILWNHGTSWLAIGIGGAENRGKGYGYEAMCLLIDFGFRELNLHRIQLTVFEYNPEAVALYQKVGFTHEATYREALHRDGRRWHIYLYGLLRREWENRTAAAL